MSKLRTDQLETLDGLHTKNVADLVDDINAVQVTTSTGEQALPDALNLRGPVFDTVAAMKAATGLTVGVKVRTLGYYVAGDGGGADYEVVSSGTASAFGFLYEELPGSGLEARFLTGGIIENKTVLIPSDFATVQESMEFGASLSIPRNVKLTHLIESGHELTHGVIFEGGNFSQHIISSEDAEVMLTNIDNFVPAESGSWTAVGRAAFAFYNCVTPVFETNIRSPAAYTSADERIWGLVVHTNSRCVVAPNCGFHGFYRNAEIRGLSSLSARQSVWRDSAQNGVRFTLRCQGDMGSALIENCMSDDRDDTGHGSLYISRHSDVYCNEITIRNSGGRGLEVRRSRVTAQLATIEGSAGVGVQVSRGGFCNLQQALSITGNGGADVQTWRGGEFLTDAASNIGSFHFLDNDGGSAICLQVKGPTQGFMLRSNGWVECYRRRTIPVSDGTSEVHSYPASIVFAEPPASSLSGNAHASSSPVDQSGVTNRYETFNNVSLGANLNEWITLVRSDQMANGRPLTAFAGVLYASGWIANTPDFTIS